MSATLFIDNKYTRIYNKIIQQAQSKTILQTYIEKHHIIPRSLGGTDCKNNLVFLTAKEHYICHLLLPKMLEGKNKYKMLCAILRMAHSNQKQRIKIPSRIYEHIKKEKARMQSQIYRGECNPFYGRNHSERTKQKLRESRARQVEKQGGTMTSEARAKLSAAAKGRKQSQTWIEKKKLAVKKTWESEELRNSVSKRFLGKPKTEDHKQKLRKASKDRASRDSKPQVQCPYCNKIGGEPSMKRWHFEKCRYK